MCLYILYIHIVSLRYVSMSCVVVCSSFSPFAPVNEERDNEMSEGDGASGGYHGNEGSSLGGIKGQMNILDQILHADCRPVLEFNMVCS